MNHAVVYVALQQFCEYDERPRKLLLGAGFEVRQNALGRRLRQEDLLAMLQDADAVIAGVEPYRLELLEALPRLRCISRCGVGTDSIDLEAAQRLGIHVCTTGDEVIEPVAQMTVGMILALARNFPLHLEDSRRGLWKKHAGFLLSEWTIGLVGFGRIGRAVERLLRPFGSRILVADPAVKSADDLPGGVELRDLASLLSQADVVSLHASRPQQEGPLMSRQQLAQMKRGSYLVNTARGFLLDEAALLEALSSGHLAGAAIDVFEAEPYTGPLSQFPRVLCTPHVASLTRASRIAMEGRAAQQVIEWFAQAHASRVRVGTMPELHPIQTRRSSGQ